MKEKIIIGSVTYAIKAKKEIVSKGVFARVVKASQKQSKGCSYGLEFEAKDRMRVYAVLDELGIAYRRN